MTDQFQNRIFVFLERLWLVAAILGILCVVFFLIQKDNDSALFFFGFFILSAILYLMRKRQRKRHDKHILFKNEENKKNKA